MVQRFVCGFNSDAVAEFVRILTTGFCEAVCRQNSHEFCDERHLLSAPFEDADTPTACLTSAIRHRLPLPVWLPLPSGI